MQTTHTEQQKRAFMEQYNARRMRQFVTSIPAILVSIVSLLFRHTAGEAAGGIPKSWLLPALCLSTVLILVVSFFNWRCPACNAYLGRSMNPHFCPNCGVELRS